MLIERPYIIDAQILVVWNFIKKIETFVKCVPDVEQIVKKNDKRFILIVRPKLAFFKGSLEMDCTVKEMKNNRGILKVKGKSIGSSFDALTEITLVDKKKKTSLHWKTEVNLKGLLKHVPESLIQGTAYFIADRMIKNLNNELSILCDNDSAS